MFVRQSLSSLIALLLLAWVPGIGTSSSRGEPRRYSVIEKWKLGGEGGWDRLAVDSKQNRLYVLRSNRIVVVDTRTGQKLGEINGARNVHSVCLDPDGQQGWLADGAAGMVDAFDRSTFRITASIPIKDDPDAMVFDPTTRSVFAFTGEGHGVTAIDGLSNRILGTLSLPGRPAEAVSDGKGALFASLQDTSRIVRIDTTSREIRSNWPLPTCIGPTGIAVDHGRVFSVCENRQLLAIDAATGKILASTEVEEGARNLAVDPQSRTIFVASGSGTLSVVKQRSSGELWVAQTLKTQPGARTLALDSATSRIYLPTAQFGMRTGEISEELRFRPTPVPGSFVVVVVGD
jgi:DNA-binding beta-propeller fold protein YncE